MALPQTPEDWLLETGDGQLTVSWPELGDVLHDRLDASRVSFGYSAVDGDRVAQLGGSSTWLLDASGRRIHVRIERVDSDLKVAVGEVLAPR